MSLIHCCGALQKTKAFVCDPDDGYLFRRIDWLPACRRCRSTVLQVTRLGLDHKVSYFRRTGDDARALFDKLRTSIIYELSPGYSFIASGSRSYLRYSHFGSKRRCYSSLSALRLGLFENLDLPQNNFIPLPAPLALPRQLAFDSFII